MKFLFKINKFGKYQRYYDTFISFGYAVHVSVGDEILVQVNNKLTPAKVTNVSNIIVEGYYLFNNPHRLEAI